MCICGREHRLELRFDNNDRNIQLLMPLTINVTCSGGPCVGPPPVVRVRVRVRVMVMVMVMVRARV